MGGIVSDGDKRDGATAEGIIVEGTNEEACGWSWTCGVKLCSCVVDVLV